jgi:hypothetical protein
MDRHGITFKNVDLDEDEGSRCAGHGFEMLREGELAFRHHLQSMLERFYTRSTFMGGRSLFGRLYEMMAHGTKDPAFDPIRDILKDVTIESLPLGPGDEFFGPVTERRLHSVQSASKQFGIHPKRLLRLLVNSGTVAPNAAIMTFDRIVVDAAAMEQFAMDAMATIDAKEAKVRLGLPEASFEELVRGGALVPYGGADYDKDRRGASRRFQISQVDELLVKLRSAVTTEATDEMVDIYLAARKATCTIREIFDLLLSDSLMRVATLAPKTTFRHIRLDPNEIKSKTRLEDHGCFTLREVEALLPSTTRTVKALVVEGHLPSKLIRNASKRSLQPVVEPAALELFKAEYASIGNLATKLGTRTWSLLRELDQANILPAFEVAETRFYRRSDADRLIR